MAALDIHEIIVTQTQVPVVVFAPLSNLAAGQRYAIVADLGGVMQTADLDPLKTATDDSGQAIAIGRAGQMYMLNQPYTLNVVILDQDYNVVSQGAEFAAAPDIVINAADLIQQAIYDVVIEHTLIDTYGRPVAVLDDGLFQPEDLGDGDIGAIPMPFIEIKRPVYAGADTFGNAAMLHTYALDIDISDTEILGKANDVAHLYNLARQIIQIIKTQLRLEAAGIFGKAITFSLDTGADITQGDNLNTVTISASVRQVQSL